MQGLPQLVLCDFPFRFPLLSLESRYLCGPRNDLLGDERPRGAGLCGCRVEDLASVIGTRGRAMKGRAWEDYVKLTELLRVRVQVADENASKDHCIAPYAIEL